MEVDDESVGSETYKTQLVATDSLGYTYDTFTSAFGGALEIYNITTCDALPASGVYFTNIIVSDDAGQVVPNFGPTSFVDSSASLQCGFAVSSTSSSATLADSATTYVRAQISGPSSVAAGASGTWTAEVASPPHTGTAPYTYEWSGILTGSGATITGVPSASGLLNMTITDALGYRYTASMSVTVCSPGVLSC
ncbi:MAG TPA: hypothetical protein VHB25_20025 [Gemmatimonadaceae bacterium]|nr:hypothetical protein [Gemmatimonadaceae bacterium]